MSFWKNKGAKTCANSTSLPCEEDKAANAVYDTLIFNISLVSHHPTHTKYFS